MNSVIDSSLPTSAGPTAASTRRPLSRNAAIVLAVVGIHVAFIWALQSGLLMRAAEIVVPAEVLAQFVDPPAPVAEPVPIPLQPLVPPEPKKAMLRTQPAPRPQPQPLTITNPTPFPNAPTEVVTPTPQTAPIVAAPAAPATTAAPSAFPPAAVQLPSSDADYLQNPRPPYPPLSKRLNEQGKTTLRVLIGVDGLPQRAEIVKSSGFERLDQAAMATVMRWRYLPGKRGGVAEAMWFNVPINWVLE